MKKHIYSFIFLVGVFVLSCTPKTGTNISEAPKDMDVVKDAVTTDFRSQAPSPGPARSIKIGKAQQFNLVNGLKVIVVENHKIPRVSYQLFIDRDPLYEGDIAGFSSFAGQLLSTGTKTKSKAEIDEAVDFIGANLSTNSTGGFASSLKKHTDQILELFADVILNPSFPAEEFDKIKKQTLSNIAAEKDDPNAIARNVSSVVNYGQDHAYGEIQTEESINNIALADCKKYYEDYFKPNKAYLVIVGDITEQEAEVQANTYFGNWKGGNMPQHPFQSPAHLDESAIEFVDKSGAVQSVINITYPVELKPGSADVIPASLMNNILGYGGFSGRLFQNLREDKAYTYGAYSSLSSDKHSGSFSAQSSVRNEVTDSAIVEILNEMKRINVNPVSEEELQLTKNLVFGQFARSMESPQTIARFALNTARYNLPDDYYQTYLEKVEAVTIDDIQRVAKKYIRPENAHIVVVGNKDEVVDKLKPIATINYYDNFGNKVDLMPTKPIDLEPSTIIENYVKAIGGMDMLKGIKDSYLKMEANVPQMGGAMVMEQYTKDNTKFKMAVTMQGMTVQEQIFDGLKMQVSQMGNSEIVEDENALMTAKEQAITFKEIFYAEKGYKLKISGTEKIGDTEAIKLIVTDPNGSKTTEFYDRKSFLKVKEISTQEVQGQQITNTTEFENYRDINGIKVPHKITITGAMPIPLTFELKEGKFNGGVSDDLFNIE